MSNQYKVVFEGKFKAGTSQSEVRQRLLKLYKGNHSVVNLFFSKKLLIIKKNIDRQTAFRYKASLEKAGVVCRIVEEKIETIKASSTSEESKQTAPTFSKTLPKYKDKGKDVSRKEETEHYFSYDLSLRGILAESWGRIYGVKGIILAATLITVMLSFLPILLGYGITLFLGELGRNLYVVYGFQYAFATFTYPLLAGVVMLGVRRAINKPANFSAFFSCFTLPIILLSVIISISAYIVFALLLFGGLDHFIARVSNILFLPIFTLVVPLIVEKKLKPFEAIYNFFKIFIRNRSIIIITYLALYCINIAANFIIIGIIWSVPLLFVANGILYRNLVKKEFKEGVRVGFESDIHVSLPTAQQLRRKPALTGSSFQNFLAALMVILLLVNIGGRLWAIYKADKIYPPDNVAGNGNSVCIHLNKALFFFTPDGHLQQRLELENLGFNREPADIELLESGNILIGDMDKKAILRCDIEKLSCTKIGPAKGYKINDNFKFLADEKRNMLFIADTNNHRLIVQDMEGSYINELESNSNIGYPNDMTFDKNGLLWISNTLHERILPFEIIDGDTAVETGEAINLGLLHTSIETMTQTLLGKRDPKESLADLKNLQEDLESIKKAPKELKYALNHTRPLAIAWGPDNNIWVAASDPYLTTAGVRVLNSEGKQIKRIVLKEESIPEDIISIGDKLLVADTGVFQVFSILPGSYEVSIFGDETFQNELLQARNTFEFYCDIKKWTKYSIFLLAIGTVVLAFIILRKQRSLKKTTEKTK